MSNYKITIGCEVHTELRTNSKMFSSAPNISNAKVNTCICEQDLGLDGALPSVNKRAVEFGIILADLLGMQIETNLIFDRKNYFYQDLPKGFQITQQYFPIGREGKIGNIGVERIHLEEDTAKQNNINGQIFLDYNRCGVPLIEIVSKPEMHSKEDTLEYLKELKRTLTFSGVSDGKMENGSLRVDLNISVSNTDVLGTKVEIKNINSFSNVLKAIDYEFSRQTAILESGKTVEQETRRWDDTTGTTIFMRSKANAIDYRYFTEPNIINIDISSLVSSAIASKNKHHNEIKQDLLSSNVNEILINQLLDDFELFGLFNYVSSVTDYNSAITWIVVELTKYLNADNKKPEHTTQSILNRTIEMINYLKAGKINGKQAKTIFENIYKTEKTVDQIIKENNLVQITDKNIINEVIRKIAEANPQMVQQYKERPDRAEKFFIGQVMKETQGQANPQIVNECIKEILG